MNTLCIVCLVYTTILYIHYLYYIRLYMEYNTPLMKEIRAIPYFPYIQ